MPTKPGSPGARPRRRRPRRRFWRWVGYLFVFFFLALIGGTGYAAMYVLEQYRALPAAGRVDPERMVGPLSTIIYDRNGKELAVLTGKENENRIYVPLKDIPRHVQDAFIAIEDARFWQHRGFDPRRLVAAAWIDLKYLVTGKGDIQGASTITQQFVKNAYNLDRGRKLSRKVQELLLAIQLERSLSKEEILEGYLNEIYFGYNFYGIGAAAKEYFGKHPKDLTIAEAAMLAGMVQAPATYDPYKNPEAAKERQEIVLDQMLRWGFITQEQWQQARAEKLHHPGLSPIVQPQRPQGPGAHFVDYVIRVLTDEQEALRYGIQPMQDSELFRGGYKIYTTFDPQVQAIADRAVAKVMDPQVDKRFAMPADRREDWIQVGVAVVRPSTGEILALVGGRDHTRMRELNRATDTLRQPGSAMKPLAAYTPAVELLGWGPGTVIDDAPFKVDPASPTGLWPRNYDNTYWGLIPMRRAIEASRNAAAVQTIAKVGPEKAVEIASLLGIRTLVKDGPRNDVQLATALGGLTRGVSVLDMTLAYSTLANLGLRVDPVIVTRIVDRDGQVIFEAKPRRRQVIKESTAWLMVDMMKGVIRRGTAAAATKGLNGWPAAGKTGTTENKADAWFVGFTRDLAVGVWNGYDNREAEKPRSLEYAGADAPTRIWTEIMLAAHRSPPEDWPRPASVIPVEICAKTGLLPSAMCPQTTTEWFARGTQPTQPDYPGFWTDPIPVVKEVVQQPDGSSKEVWRRWQPGCAGVPENRSFLIRPDFPRSPKDPNNPRYLPQDLSETAPTETCTPVIPPAWLGGPPGSQPGSGSEQPGWLFPQEPAEPPAQGPGQGPGQAPGHSGQPGQASGGAGEAPAQPEQPPGTGTQPGGQ
ncbi:transglycosylase domain-containing protein [Caldinitratiruptor microaerophilus]|uniref:Penicillin-binding protein 1A n=1 Tax=Caldinitratiruptor microaerophilus TaxID=671077 RepID=A0AA35CLX3_9FIRM|nr:PBP1A family penicillin-binding protein [Caldinitratiruptor microaerophilus]BDG60818.1 hypothetical protein caldi_19080 [Caldinitratiruptor microaerophilus]